MMDAMHQGAMSSFMWKRICASSLLCACLGCASLAIRPEDSLGARIGKLGVRLPLSVLTLSLSEFQIQDIESGRKRDMFEVEQRARIDEARAKAAAATSYDEYLEWIEYAGELEAELERRRAARKGTTPASGGAGEAQDGSKDRSSSTPACVSTGEGQKVVTECR